MPRTVKFSAMLDRIGVDQPRWKELSSMEDINGFVAEVGFPVLVRPSYVLSGAAMNVCSNQEELERFLKLAANVSQKHPVVVKPVHRACERGGDGCRGRSWRDRDVCH